MDLHLYASVPKGMESLLAGELRGLGARRLRQRPAGVAFDGSLQTAYRACLWSRLASRVLLELATGPGATSDDLYSTVRAVPWDQHFNADDTFAVTFTGANDGIRDTRFGAMRVKDAIVDQFRERDGARPSVDARHPDVRIHAHLARGRLVLSIDLCGESLHRRGYRADKVQVRAPLKENLAAAMLMYAEWPREMAWGASFLDPLCGSGTVLIEAALMAADVAPGLLRAESRRGFGFLNWRGHHDAIWQDLFTEARERREEGLRSLRSRRPGLSLHGSDRDPAALRIAEACVARAGVGDIVTLSCADLADIEPPAEDGLIVTNVPYGERLGERDEALDVCRSLGHRLRGDFHRWRAAVLAADSGLLDALALVRRRQTEMYNGPLRCTLAYFGPDSREQATVRSARAAARSSRKEDVRRTPPPELSNEARERTEPASIDEAISHEDAAGQFANRLRKNQRRLGRRLRRGRISCYRLYDADLPNYNMVVDVYGDMVHVQEYAAPPEIEASKARRRVDEAVTALASVLQIPRDHIVLKERRRQRGSAQYQRHNKSGSLLPVVEDDLTYLVNLTDYLDTGLFIDQRLTRRLVRNVAWGRRFLNLFAYTGTMTVDALAGGASSSVSVDLSSTYLGWAQRNLAANGFFATLEHPPESGTAATNRLIQADCLRWVSEAEGQWDLIWLDPPTFSNSKRMGQATFDVQRDHADLLRLVVRRLLAPDGILLFSTNRRSFRLDEASLTGVLVEDLSQSTLPFDCERSASRHHVYRLQRTASTVHDESQA